MFWGCLSRFQLLRFRGSSSYEQLSNRCAYPHRCFDPPCPIKRGIALNRKMFVESRTFTLKGSHPSLKELPPLRNSQQLRQIQQKNREKSPFYPLRTASGKQKDDSPCGFGFNEIPGGRIYDFLRFETSNENLLKLVKL